MRAHRLILILALLAAAFPRAQAASPTASPVGQLHLKQAASWTPTPAPSQSAGYRLNARFAPQESAGTLREGGGLSLIGRFAKGAQSCSAGSIFGNGFESN